MAKIDLSQQPGATPVEGNAHIVDETAASKEAAKQEATSTAVSKPSPSGLILGDKVPEFKDIILPRVNLVQGVGLLKDTFPQGAIVHNQRTILYEPTVVDTATGNVKKQGTKPLEFTVLGFREERFAEKVEGGARGLILDSEADVRANGGTLDYNEWKLKRKDGMKRFEILVDALVVIARPDHLKDDDTVFNFPCGDKKYAIALWGMKGSSYTQCAKKVFYTERAIGCLKAGGYPSWCFSLVTRSKTFEGNTYYIPVATPLKKNDETFLAFARNILTAPTAEADDQSAE